MFETLLTGPTGEPITVEELANFSRFDAPDETEDALDFAEVSGQIGAAREQIERQTSYCYDIQKWQMTLDAFPSIYVGREMNWHFNIPEFVQNGWVFRPDVIELLRHPVQSIDSFKYTDANGDEQTVDSGIYDLKNDRIVLKVGKTWPVAAHVPDSVTIQYTAGYDPEGSPAIPTPQRLIRALKFLAGWYYDNRMPIGTQPTAPVQMTLDNLLTGFRSNRMAR